MGSYWLGVAVHWFVTPLAGAEAVLFSDPGNQPGNLYTPEEEPSLDQSVIVQLHPDLCFYRHICFL